MSHDDDPVARLRADVRDHGIPLLAAFAAPPPSRPPAEPSTDPAELAASGPRVAADRAEIELAVRAVLEGCLLHYGQPHALAIDDPNLALLAGDRLYALGLAHLAKIGDMTAITELADVIGLSAQAHAAGDAELALAAWHAGAAVIGWGADVASDAAKQRARAGDPGAAAALHAVARRAYGAG